MSIPEAHSTTCRKFHADPIIGFGVYRAQTDIDIWGIFDFLGEEEGEGWVSDFSPGHPPFNMAKVSSQYDQCLRLLIRSCFTCA